ncbi:MAG: hypothetical protein WCK62_04710 [Actinomycetes bacterium]
MLLHTLAATFHFAAQEDGSLPGKGLTAIQTVLLYVAAPVGLFTLIAGTAYALTGERKSKSSAISHIE